MKIKIDYTQADITRAIRADVETQGVVLPVTGVEYKAGRQGKGISAEVIVGDTGTSETEIEEEEIEAPKPTPRKKKVAAKKAPKPVVEEDDEEPAVGETITNIVSPEAAAEDEAADAELEEEAEAQEEEAAPVKAAPAGNSLFSR